MKILSQLMGLGLLLFIGLVIWVNANITPEERARLRAEREERNKAVAIMAAAPPVAHAAETKPATPAPVIAKVPDTGKWYVSRDRSPIDDSETVYLSVQANEPIQVRLSFSPVYPRLSIRCQENTTSLVINWNTYLGIDARPITYRIDKEPAQTPYWNIYSKTS